MFDAWLCSSSFLRPGWLLRRFNIDMIIAAWMQLSTVSSEATPQMCGRMGKLKKNYSIYYADAWKWFRTLLPSQTLLRESHLYDRQMTDSFIQKIKWFVLSWMGNSVSLFTRSKVTAADAVFPMQSEWGEGTFHWEPPYKLHKWDGGGGEKDRVCDCFPGYGRTFDFFSLLA